MPTLLKLIHFKMNRAKLTTTYDNSNIDFVGVLSNVLPRQNGTVAGVSALAESLKRTDAYLKAQERINEICLVKEVSHV